MAASLLLLALAAGCAGGARPHSGFTLPDPAPLPTREAGPHAGAPSPGATPAPTRASASPVPLASAPLYRYQIVQVYPHDPEAFTQGLVYADGALYEGTGLHGRSTLRRVALETGAVVQSVSLEEGYFGEGVTVWGQRIVQLTWQSGVGFVYDRRTFARLGQFAYPWEGWGLTHDGARLVMSDGTDTLHFLDPESFAELGRVRVLDRGGPVTRLNELEYVRGEIFANVWGTERVARIHPVSGQVLGWIDLSGLLSAQERAGQVDVLNGIAYDPAGDRLFVTGKWWPKLFEIRLLPAGP